MNSEDWANARIEERMFIVRFLRKYTNLCALAGLFADGAHLKSERDLRAYALERRITLRSDQ